MRCWSVLYALTVASSACGGDATSSQGNAADPSFPDASTRQDTPRAGRAGSGTTAGQPAADAGAGPRDAGTRSDAATSDTPEHPADAGSPDAGEAQTPSKDASVAPEDAPDAAVPAAGSCKGPPGLYKDADCKVPSDDVLPYHPRYPLWSDGATKERFISLPANTLIDTSNPDRWRFPVGTRIYKTFAVGDLKVETRILEKTIEGAGYNAWTANTYAWAADQRSAPLADMGGVKNALGTELDIPSQLQCQLCHSMNASDAPIGFNAIQLNHHEDGVTLADLIAQGLLVNGSADAAPNITLENAVIAGDEVTQAALGYLHGNCGHCHGGPTPRVNQRLWSTVSMSTPAMDQPGTDAPIFQTAVCKCLVGWTGRSNDAGDKYLLRVVPSHAQDSGIIGRMSSRAVGEQMPPINTKHVDPAGLAAVKAWIDALDASDCDASMISCTP